MKKTIFILLSFCFFLSLSSTVLGSDRPYRSRKSFFVYFSLGNWQPHSLNREPRFYTFGEEGATALVHLGIIAPLSSSIGIDLSLGHWALRELTLEEETGSLVLTPVSLNLRHWLIPDYFFSPYVVYGASLYWGAENETHPLTGLQGGKKGWGVNLGAGFDLILSEQLMLGATFYYHYVDFPDPVGGVDDFSGPCISAALYWFL